jgi:hypothetical protein
LPSGLTPPQDIKDGYLIEPSTFMPDDMDLEEIRERWGVAPTSGMNDGK